MSLSIYAYGGFQITQQIDKIVCDVVNSGQPQEIKDYTNGECGDPAIWLTADWSWDGNAWYVQVDNRYCDTGKANAHFTIYETKLSEKEYEEYSRISSDYKGMYVLSCTAKRIAKEHKEKKK